MKFTLTMNRSLVIDPLDHLDTATVALLVASGSCDEEGPARGTAHLLEHLVTATGTRQGANLLQYASSFGGRAEAVTTPEYTVYAATVPAEAFPETWRLLEGHLLAPDITDETVETQRQLVLDEIAGSTSDPASWIYDVALRELFDDAGLGYPARGREDDIRCIGTDDLVSQHRRQRKRRTLALVSGGVDQHEAEWRLGASTLWDAPGGTDPMRSTRTIRVADRWHRLPVASSRSHVLVTWVLPDRTRADDLPVSVLNRIVGGTSDSVLQRAFTRADGSYSCHTYRAQFSDCAVWSAYAACGVGQEEQTATRIIAAVGEAGRGVLTDNTTLEHARRALTGSLAIGLESTRMRVNWLGRMMLDGADAATIREAVGGGAHGTVMAEVMAEIMSRMVGPQITILEGTR